MSTLSYTLAIVLLTNISVLYGHEPVLIDKIVNRSSSTFKIKNTGHLIPAHSTINLSKTPISLQNNADLVLEPQSTKRVLIIKNATANLTRNLVSCCNRFSDTSFLAVTEQGEKTKIIGLFGHNYTIALYDKTRVPLTKQFNGLYEGSSFSIRIFLN